MATVKCVLRCINNLHKPIPLPHGKDVSIGRGPETGITDKRCSRNQVTLCADTKEMQVKIIQVGPNVTGVNGMALGRGRSQILSHNDRLEILLGEYIHKVEFDPAPEVNVSKRAIQPMDDVIASKKMRSDNGHSNHSSLATEDKWEDIDGGQLLIYTGKNVQGRSWIAAYDLDGTIITTKSGRVFPKDIDDWKIAFSEVPGKLKQLWSEGYKIVILSNQAGIARGNVKPGDFKSKLVKIISKLGVPIQAFVSTGKAIYRKPAPGMWNVLVEKKNDGVAVDMSKSFYCGDAAGRIENWAPKKKKDFSCSDRLFALNLNLQFYTPEEHFLKQKPGQYKLPNFNPSSLKKNIPICDPEDASFASEKQEFREFTDSTHEKITDMVMNSYKTKYEEPSLDEGFSSIVKINCVPRFDDPSTEKLYRMYLMEK